MDSPQEERADRCENLVSPWILAHIPGDIRTTPFPNPAQKSKSREKQKKSSGGGSSSSSSKHAGTTCHTLEPHVTHWNHMSHWNTLEPHVTLKHAGTTCHTLELHVTRWNHMSHRNMLEPHVTRWNYMSHAGTTCHTGTRWNHRPLAVAETVTSLLCQRASSSSKLSCKALPLAPSRNCTSAAPLSLLAIFLLSPRVAVTGISLLTACTWLELPKTSTHSNPHSFASQCGTRGKRSPTITTRRTQRTMPVPFHSIPV